MKNEPVLTVASVVGIFHIALALALSFGLKLTVEQVGLIESLAFAILTPLWGTFLRSKVSPAKEQ